MNTFLLVGIVTDTPWKASSNNEIRESLLVILHVLPRTDSLNAEDLWRHPLITHKPSTSQLRSILSRMDEDGLLTIHIESRPPKNATSLATIRVRLTNDGHAAARKIAKQEAMKHMDTEHS